MAPDADKLRQRKQQLRGDEALTSNPTSSSSSDYRIIGNTLEQLRHHEVCIDGVIYDLKSFDHPGGESFLIFGGNDVSVQYRMIHPYHTSKHLEKMKTTGKVADYTSEYKFDTPFELEIKREVFKIVHRGKEFATNGYLMRAMFYLSCYFYFQYHWIMTGSSFALAIIYGIIQALIGMNVQHDANHGAVSGKYPWMNNVLGLGADLIGGSKWLWMEQHWTHHAYTNHQEKDPDALSGEPIFLWTDYAPDHPKRNQSIHRFQGIYYMFILALYWISEVFNPQVLDLRQRGAQATGIRMESDYCKERRKFSTALRLYYIAVHVVVPIYQHGIFYGLLHALTLGFTESLTLAILFSLSHNFEGCDRDPIHESKRDENGKVCWFQSQVETSCTYGGTISGYLTGGLNFQIEHHLFPRMSSAWYPYIAPTVRQVCQKHGVKYTYYPWVLQNWRSTFLYMCKTGTGANWRDGNPYSGKL